MAPPASNAVETATARGRRGEQIAEAYLCSLGYRVIARNHRCPGGELDLVAWDAETLCFIEVRARASETCGHPLETITPRKRRRVIRAAAHYLEAYPGLCSQMRFDALGVLLTASPQFFLVRDAFEVT